MRASVKNIVVCVILFLTSGVVYAVSRPPKLLRICLDRPNQTATIYWNPSDDPCATFEKYVIYGREDIGLLFSPMAENTNLTANSQTIALPNLRRWQFKIVARFACNGVDTLESDMLFVDDEEPPEMTLDSVSVDLGTQLLYAGWSRNSAPDLQGYFLYKVGASNVRIGDTPVLHYTFRDIDTRTGGNRIAIAAYDSCGQAGIISTDHQPILLSGAPGAYCDRRYNLTFSPYRGWVVDRYEVFMQTGVNAFRKVGDVAGTGPYSISLPLGLRGSNYAFYVRAFRSGSAISSSSNMLNYFYDSLPEPGYRYLSRVSHLDNDRLEITGFTESGLASVSELVIEHSSNGFTWNNWLRVPYTTGSFRVVRNITQSSAHYFRFYTTDICNTSSTPSNHSRNITLSGNPANPALLEWNEYIGWDGTVQVYELLQGERNTNVSTWNVYQSAADASSPIDVSNAENKSLCYCVRAIENGPNTYARIDSAYSNTICPFSGFDIHIPNAFRPNGDHNKTFQASGLSLDKSLSTIEIYDRWGAKIYSYNLTQGWDGKNKQGQLYPFGAYVYVLRAVDASGVVTHHRGTVHLMN
jgi:gliding motility-associated-like protein